MKSTILKIIRLGLQGEKESMKRYVEMLADESDDARFAERLRKYAKEDFGNTVIPMAKNAEKGVYKSIPVSVVAFQLKAENYANIEKVLGVQVRNGYLYGTLVLQTKFGARGVYPLCWVVCDDIEAETELEQYHRFNKLRIMSDSEFRAKYLPAINEESERV